MTDDGFRLACDPFTGRYVPDFDRDAVYDFRRMGSREIETFRLSDTSDHFNVYGLMFRPRAN